MTELTEARPQTQKELGPRSRTFRGIYVPYFPKNPEGGLVGKLIIIRPVGMYEANVTCVEFYDKKNIRSAATYDFSGRYEPLVEASLKGAIKDLGRPSDKTSETLVSAVQKAQQELFDSFRDFNDPEEPPKNVRITQCALTPRLYLPNYVERDFRATLRPVKEIKI